MLIEELTKQESVDLLTRARLGRLACAHETQPYIVPIYFAYDNGYLYSFSTVGQKFEWMQLNPNVCVEVDEVVSPQQWMSVIVLGHYQELPNIPEWRDAREYAHGKLLQRNAIWWQPGYAKRYYTMQNARWCHSSTALTSCRLPAAVPPLST